MTDQPAPSAATEATDSDRIAEIRGKHDACIASGDDLCDVPFLLAHIDRLIDEQDRSNEILRFVEGQRDALRAELTASQGREAALATELNWQRHRADCGQCNMRGVRPLCPRGNGLFSAMADAAHALLAAPDRAASEVRGE